ncbi:response regulator [Alkaliphilus serpentinus]|uniref:Stage 0 sporulation protein A homolog n=1 Tax=Alkaliphilus serpentinus TaxID=1482731 RepID=A0A833HM67_9FIRM|nr:response regulator [Alkaliphilus serpentinus]KAB3527131.1 response regulator [Alkaliphilus serpentinus]
MVSNEKIVLIVDDSPAIRRQVSLILNKAKIVVREAGSEFGMLNAIEEYGKLAEVIIMDLTLKNESGFDLITKLKEYPQYSNIPILVLTEHAEVDKVLMARNLGVKGYLKKPIDVDELLERVKALL